MIASKRGDRYMKRRSASSSHKQSLAMSANASNRRLALLERLLGEPRVGEVANADGHASDRTGVVAQRLQVDAYVPETEAWKIEPALRTDTATRERLVDGILEQPAADFPELGVAGAAADDFFLPPAKSLQESAVGRHAHVPGVEYAQHVTTGAYRGVVGILERMGLMGIAVPVGVMRHLNPAAYLLRQTNAGSGPHRLARISTDSSCMPK